MGRMRRKETATRHRARQDVGEGRALPIVPHLTKRNAALHARIQIYISCIAVLAGRDGQGASGQGGEPQRDIFRSNK